MTEEDIAEVVADWTGIPVTEIAEEEAVRLLNLEEVLHRRVIGQEEAIGAVSQAVRRAHAGLKDPKRPIGSFIFLGPTGVGKTELAKTLAEALFGDEDNTVRLDMSEYMERHAVARLVGAPPGYVGYDEGGASSQNRCGANPIPSSYLTKLKRPIRSVQYPAAGPRRWQAH